MDFSDFSVLHVLLITAALVFTVCNLIIEHFYGSFDLQDVIAYVTALLFYFKLELYFLSVIVLMLIHSLLPLEIDLIESSEGYEAVVVRYNPGLLPLLIAVMVLAFHLTSAKLLVLNLNKDFLKLSLLTTTLGVGLAFCVSLWDFLSSSLFFIYSLYMEVRPLLYNHGTMAYEDCNIDADAFDYHKTMPAMDSVRFGDLTLFLVQFFVMFKVAKLTFFMVIICYSVFTAYSTLNVDSSQTWLLLLKTLVENLALVLGMTYAPLLYAGVRLFLKPSVETFSMFL